MQDSKDYQPNSAEDAAGASCCGVGRSNSKDREGNFGKADVGRERSAQSRSVSQNIGLGNERAVDRHRAGRA